MEQLLSDEAYICTGVYLTVLGFFAVCGNCFVLFVLSFGRPAFIKIHLVLMYIISCSDLVVASIAYPLTAVSGYYKRWYFNEDTCVVTGFLVYFATMCSINSLCSLAVTRFIIVCKPEYEYYIRGKRLLWWVFGIFVYALFWTGAPLVGWSSYGHEPFQTSCTLNWYGTTVSDITYNSLCIVFCYCIPVAIFAFCYYNVLRTSLFRTRPVQWRLERPNIDKIIEEMSRNSKLRASRHMTWICLAMVVSFLIIWTPYTIVTLWNLVAKPVPSNVQVLPTMFAKLNCVMNPILYSAFCDRFRDAMHRIWPFKQKVFPAQPRPGSIGQSDITVTVFERARNQTNDNDHKNEIRKNSEGMEMETFEKNADKCVDNDLDKIDNEYESADNKNGDVGLPRIINVIQINENIENSEIHASTSRVKDTYES